MRVLIAPDKFKGTLTAIEVCEAISLGVKDYDPQIEIVTHPLADGGEGTLDLLETSLGLDRVYIKVADPLNREIESYYLQKNNMAYIEMAMASGLQLLVPEEHNPLKTTTYGTGQMIRHAIESGAREIYLMIGGSATNDGGTGMAEALGFVFTGENGQLTSLRGGVLDEIRDISDDTKGILNSVSFTVLTDVQNVLLGQEGASYVYGKQKGATDQMIVSLDKGLRVLSRYLNNGFENVPGAGAAGGLGYGAMSFLGAKLQSGIETIMKVTGFNDRLTRVDLIISGEGKMDLQTTSGKVIAGVSDEAAKNGIPLGVICGLVESKEAVSDHIKALDIRPLVAGEVTAEEGMTNAFPLVRRRAYELVKAFCEREDLPG